MKAKAVLIGAIAVSVAGYIWLVWGDADRPSGDWMRTFLWVSQLLTVCYLAALWAARKINLGLFHPRLFQVVLIAAVVMRLVVLVGADQKDYLSDDVYRYIWEGKLVVNGYNPFLIAPDEMAGSALADDVIYPEINFPDLPTIYPPLSQYSFALAYLIGGDSLYGFKMLSLLADLTTALLLLFFIHVYSLPRWTILIYLLSPLVMIEFLFSSHLDIFALPFLVAGLIFHNKKMGTAVGICLGLATLVKFLALFFLPLLFLHLASRKRLGMVVGFVVVLVLGYLPFALSAGWETFGSLWKYLGEWEYNGSVYEIIKLAAGKEISRYICMALFAIAAALATFYRYRTANLSTRALFLFGAYIVFAPAIFPWYLVWLFPFLLYKRSIAMLAMTGTILLSYNVMVGYYENGVWTPFGVARIIEYVLFYALLAYEFTRYRRRSVPAQI